MTATDGKKKRKSRIKVRLARDVWDVLRAASPTHLHLRNRLLTALMVTVLVDAIGSAVMLFAEGNAPSTQIHDFGDALFWTTSQMTTISSTMPNPVTGLGQIICIVLELYAITVVSTLAGMFSAFFYRRGEERDPRRGNTSR